MKVVNPIPSDKISDHIDRILVIECDQIVADFVLPLYANGVPTLLFTSQKGSINNKPSSHLTLFGQTVLPETLTLKKGFTLIAYFFKPYSLLSLFSVMARELTDQPTDLGLIDSEKSRQLQERLLNADSVETKLDLLDHYISNLITRSKSDCPVLKYATLKIAADPSKESLSLMQKDLKISERTFQRMFEKNIGVAPNQYRRISQFNSAFTQLNKKTYSKLSDLAFQNGYADQSHFIRSFKEFTGITPKEYLNYGS
jgi:AraC-like DNA-binding protein